MKRIIGLTIGASILAGMAGLSGGTVSAASPADPAPRRAARTRKPLADVAARSLRLLDAAASGRKLREAPGDLLLLSKLYNAGLLYRLDHPLLASRFVGVTSRGVDVLGVCAGHFDPLTFCDHSSRRSFMALA